MRYLLVTYLAKPNGQIDEQVQVSKNLRTKDHQICNAILDFKDQKVVKCVIEGNRLETSWEQLRGYYAQIYPDVIDKLDMTTKGDENPVFDPSKLEEGQ